MNEYPCTVEVMVESPHLSMVTPKKKPCGAESHVLEYEDDEDYYVMLCENGHRWYYETDDETWK